MRAAFDAVVAAGPYQTGGAWYRRVPAGYPAAHPRADLLLLGGISAWTEQPHPPELHTAAFADWCLGHFAALAPIERWVAELLDAERL